MYFIFLSIISFSISAKGYDFSVGGGYKTSFKYSYDCFNGFYQMFNVPVSFSYYPGKNDMFAIGFRGKFGYGLTTNANSGYKEASNSLCEFKFNNAQIEHEIYNNCSFILKIGKNKKFTLGTGLSIKYTFINIDDYSDVTIYYYVNDPEVDFIIPKSGNYNYLSIGPTFDLGLELINKAKNFSFSIMVPFEFLVPIQGIQHVNITSRTVSGSSTPLFSTEDYLHTYINFDFGIEISASFYLFKKNLRMNYM